MPRDLALQRAAQREWVRRNPDRYKRINLECRARKQAWFRMLKESLSCATCGESHPACLDFHHLDPSKKEFGVSMLGLSGHGRASVLKEISKCIVLCSNCHRKLHSKD